MTVFFSQGNSKIIGKTYIQDFPFTFRLILNVFYHYLEQDTKYAFFLS